MKLLLTQLPNRKKVRVFILLLAFIFFLFQGINFFLPSGFSHKTLDSIPLTQTPPLEQRKIEIQPTSIDISQVQMSQLLPFGDNDYNLPTFELGGNKYQITYKENEISHLQFSPNKEKIGFYVYPIHENDPLTKNKVTFVMMNINDRKFLEISEGKLRVSNWEWKNNSQFIIYINCGTGCHLAHVRSVANGKLVAEYLDKRN